MSVISGGQTPSPSKARNSAYLVAANTLTLLTQLLTIPLLIKWLGSAGYGGYVLVFSIANFILLASPNVLQASQKRITEAFAAGNSALAWRIQQTQLAICSTVAILGCAAFFAAGPFIHSPDVALKSSTLAKMFAVAGVAYLFNLLNASLVSILAALERFKQLAIRQSVERVVGVLMSLLFAYLWRSPVGIFAGLAIGGCVGFFYNLITLKRGQKDFVLRPKFDRPIAKDLFGLFFKGYPHRLLNGLGSSADRMVMPYGGVSLSQVADYGVAYRIPEAINGLLIPITDTVVPDLTRKASADPKEFGQSLSRQALTCLALSSCLILVPCSFGGPLLPILLHKYPENGNLAMYFIAFYFVFQFYFALLSKPFYALGNLQYIAPFSGFNALATIIFTIPAYHWMGIAGVAIMNAIISAIQFVPYIFQVHRHASSYFEVGSHLNRALTILGIAVGVSLGGLFVSNMAWAHKTPSVMLLFAPTTALATLWFIVKMGLIQLPASISQRLRLSPSTKGAN